MRVFQSAVLQGTLGIEHATASLSAQPLTFSGQPRKKVVKARQEFLKALDIKLNCLTLGHQVHGNRVRIVVDKNRGSGSRTPASYLKATDGLLTPRPDIALGIFTADCVPVLLADPVTGWIGALHVGWRGAVKGIVPKAFSILKKQGVNCHTVKVWIGPSICKQHYIVDRKRAAQLKKAFNGKAVFKRQGGFAVDLRKGVAGQLIRQGIARSNLEVSQVCTFENKSLPSGRRDGIKHENTLTIIYRKPQPTDLRGRRVVVYGLGVQGGGEAAVRYAIQQQAKVTAIDSKPASAFVAVRKKLQGLPVKYAFGPKNLRKLLGADVIIKNPGVPASDKYLQKAVKAKIQVTSDIGLFRAKTKNPLIAITGTKGKTTVATWLAELLRAKQPKTVLAGNIRNSPLLEKSAFDGHTPVVLELSSFQLETLDISLASKLAVITNLLPDHLDRHKTMNAYAAIKARVAKGQTAADYFIAPLDSDWPKYAKVHTLAKTFWTSDKPHPQANAYLTAGWIVIRSKGKSKRVVLVKKLKRQDLGTIRCAITVALAGSVLGYSVLQLRKILQNFPGVPERFEIVRKFKGRTFINNTTATNPASAVAGIQSVKGPCIVIAGGTDKGLPKKTLVEALNKVSAVVFLPGSATDAMASKIHVPKIRVKSMSLAVRAANEYSKPGATILLSPGAASFGLFKNEFDRGEKFIRAVKALR